jgi:hypothetical protein
MEERIWAMTMDEPQPDGSRKRVELPGKYTYAEVEDGLPFRDYYAAKEKEEESKQEDSDIPVV